MVPVRQMMACRNVRFPIHASERGAPLVLVSSQEVNVFTVEESARPLSFYRL